MNLALNTDYSGCTGSPESRLRLMAEAGFTHVHWCHQWCQDFLYSPSEIAQIRRWLHDYGLTLLDIHGSAGVEKCWFSPVEYERQAGVELVLNRMRMLRELDGTGTLMMHIPCFQAGLPEGERAIRSRQVDSLRRSLDELQPFSGALQVPIAVENMSGEDYTVLSGVLADYSPDFVGLCYDSGHGNYGPAGGLDFLSAHADRLLALHLHDNDGTGDQHQPPFYGNVDWARLAAIIRGSSYPRELSFELAVSNTPFKDNGEDLAPFLRDAYGRCLKFGDMVFGH